MRLPGATLIETDVTDRRRLQADLRAVNADAMVSCLASRDGNPRDSWAVDYGANTHLLAWALEAGVEHFTLLSAICVQKPRLQFQYAKERFERELAISGLSYSIVRPTAFFKSLSGQIRRVRAGKAFLVFGDGEQTACKPISERDLAQYLYKTLTEPALANRVLPIGGPEPAITPRGQARLLSRLLERPVPTRKISPQLLWGAARVLDIPGRISQRLAAKAEFARIGHYYATESMLLWDEERQRYDAAATPSFGSETLEECYRALLDGDKEQRLGAQAMFDRGK